MQWVTSLGTAPMLRLASAVIVAVKVTWPRNARSHARFNAATVTNMAILARSVLSLAIVSVPSRKIKQPMDCLLTQYDSVSHQVSELPRNGSLQVQVHQSSHH